MRKQSQFLVCASRATGICWNWCLSVLRTRSDGMRRGADGGRVTGDWRDDVRGHFVDFRVDFGELDEVDLRGGELDGIDLGAGT